MVYDEAMEIRMAGITYLFVFRYDPKSSGANYEQVRFAN
jgi:hypothetical protein